MNTSLRRVGGTPAALLLLSSALILLELATPAQGQGLTTVSVGARSNIFSAGQAASFGGGIVPPVVLIPPGTARILRFTDVTGTITRDGFTPNGADGATDAGSSTNINSTQGISGIVCPGRGLFLAGVFLDDSTPADPAPPRLTFADINFASLSPQLRQAFFVGDGKSNVPAVQEFKVPVGATRLCLGYLDGSLFQGAPGTYSDNTGALAAEFYFGTVDTDDDALPDDWELNGLTQTIGGVTQTLDLKAMGADPNRKDIFVEIDYMEDRGWCVFNACVGGHNHRLSDSALGLVKQAFVAQGIELHIDNGRDSTLDPSTGATWGSLSRSGPVRHIEPLVEPLRADPVLGYTYSDEYLAIKALDSIRLPVFHYCLSVHSLEGNCEQHPGMCRKGEGQRLGSDFLVALGACCRDAYEHVGDQIWLQAGGFMHELGHNLGREHGGDLESPEINYKPNYLSVMNYLFATTGLRFQGADGVFDYSRFAAADLTEGPPPLGLDEGQGIRSASLADSRYGTRFFCPGVPQGPNPDRVADFAVMGVNWDCDADQLEPTVQANINGADSPADEFLKSYEDWSRLKYGSPLTQSRKQVATADEGTFGIPSEDGLGVMESAARSRERDMRISGGGSIATLPGVRTIPVPFVLENTGLLADTYNLTASSSAGWSTTGVPLTVSLAPGASATMSLQVTVPAGAGAGSKEILELKATSQGNPRLFDEERFEVTIVDAASAPRFGDLDNNATVDVFDVVTLMSYIVGNVTQGSAPFNGPTVVAHLNSDGRIDVFDVVVLMGYIVGNVTMLPIP